MSFEVSDQRSADEMFLSTTGKSYREDVLNKFLPGILTGNVLSTVAKLLGRKDPLPKITVYMGPSDKVPAPGGEAIVVSLGKDIPLYFDSLSHDLKDGKAQQEIPTYQLGAL